ncbi:MAG: prepilin-type N-terminal cleavage/methylation domain-containing protein [Actinobacteria bacterium]|nr:prepilin-type N-terminal cleavage/methylation domain-containing protein [Actinomycetota bacterium]MBU4219938.1 prepilin-type N-terminal cleavage/methylation domain-containing protein [Actinomycetota bacterium]
MKDLNCCGISILIKMIKRSDTTNLQSSIFNLQFGSGLSSLGFTLIEILIAIFIFSIIVTTVFSSFNAILNNTGSISEELATYDMAKNCLNRIIADLKSIHAHLPGDTSLNSDSLLGAYRIVGENTDVGSREFSKLRFTSLAHINLEHDIQYGIAELVYYVQEIDENNYVIRRSDSLYPYKFFKKKDSDPLLCERVKSLKFKYYGYDENEYDYWDSQSDEFGHSTPRAISIALEVDDEPNSILLEAMVTIPVYREKNR